ncbi:MAG TPA: NPCBM/NEW2 domain-containing protein [Puia sp.]|nr:NPCBM/NEW2 domain-containing protein [Puia sp.]
MMNTKRRRVGTMVLLLLSLAGCTGERGNVWMDDLPIQTYSDGIPGISVRARASGDTMRLGGVVHQRGVGVKCVSVLAFYLDGKGRRFTALAGVDDRGLASVGVKFYVIGDKKILFESGEMHAGDGGKPVDVDLTGVRRLGLLVTADTANMSKVFPDWADARFRMQEGYKPENVPNTGERYILTPAAGAAPRINGARVYGATASSPFLFTVAASGVRPLHFSAEGLPAGLSMDGATGIITGKVSRKGNYPVRVTVRNASGEDKGGLMICIGDTIALTPPMGWNGWNSWARNIDREKVMASARALVEKGLRDHGWSYINIDDAWQGQRTGGDHALQPNGKFPRFKEMVDSLHSMGLKAGVYSTPWISSYAGFAGGSSDFADGAYPDSIAENKRAYRRIGKYRFEKEDARQMAAWGIDFLKYDWHIDVSSAERMSEALRHSGRDIVYSLSNSAPFANAPDWARLSNMWRTGPDIRDSWNSLYVSAFTIDKWGPYGGRGHWNDPDMMIVGKVTTASQLHPTRLTPDEQYSHVSLYSLLAAPMIIGCPLEQLDAFDLNLLTNDEVIAIDQDALGEPARLVSDEGGVQTWVRPMEDGSYAVGLFNTADFGRTPESYFRWGDEKPVGCAWKLAGAGLKGRWKLRDVWRQKDLGVFEGSFSTSIPYHGVLLLRVFPEK